LERPRKDFSVEKLGRLKDGISVGAKRRRLGATVWGPNQEKPASSRILRVSSKGGWIS